MTRAGDQTDKGIVLASALIGHLRRRVILPALNAVERASAERSPVLTGASRRLGRTTGGRASPPPRRSAQAPGQRQDDWLAWLRQSPAKPNSRHMLEHRTPQGAQALDLPTGIERLVHQNRLLKIAHEGGQMTPPTAKFRPQRRYALVALATEGMPPSPTKSSTCTTASR
ncbi:Putative transposase (identified by ISEscan HMM) [Escherichia coli]|nr:Putative transposase (identified by ISEscan HMM) [Escherichia coli]